MSNLLNNPDFTDGVYEPIGQVSLVIPNGWLGGWLDNGKLYRIVPQSSVSAFAIFMARTEAMVSLQIPSQAWLDGYGAMGYKPQSTTAYLVQQYGLYNKRGPRARPNMAPCLKPEILQIAAVEPYLDPARTEPPDNSVTGFKLYGTTCWWLMQQVEVIPGRQYRLSMRAHAWARSEQDPPDAHYSHNVGTGPYHATEGTPGAEDNYRFRVGVDLNGDLDAMAASVQWGSGIHIYNKFYAVPECVFIATGHTVTVFFMVDNLWGYINSNAYLSRPVLEDTSPPLEELTIRVEALESKVANHEARITILERASGSIPPIVPPPPPAITYHPPNIKGGIHVVVDGSHDGYGAVINQCANADRPVCVLAMMDFGALAEATDAAKHAYRVIRLRPQPGDEDTPPGNWELPIDRAAPMARDWMSKIYPQLDQNRKDIYDWVQIMNEPDPSTPQAMEWANAFVMECMSDAERHGVKLAIWGWSTGTPRTPLLGDPFAQMEASLSTLDYAAKHGHCLLVHEGPVDPEHRLLKDGEGTLALRYRVIKRLMDDRGLQMPPVIVGEAYQVNGYNRPDFNDWSWYLNELAKDPFVYGSCWYTLGDGGDYNYAGRTLLRYGDMLATLPIAG